MIQVNLRCLTQLLKTYYGSATSNFLMVLLSRNRNNCSDYQIWRLFLCRNGCLENEEAGLDVKILIIIIAAGTVKKRQRKFSKKSGLIWYADSVPRSRKRLEVSRFQLDRRAISMSIFAPTTITAFLCCVWLWNTDGKCFNQGC